jgi:hypothetical protein
MPRFRQWCQVMVFMVIAQGKISSTNKFRPAELWDHLERINLLCRHRRHLTEGWENLNGTSWLSAFGNVHNVHMISMILPISYIKMVGLGICKLPEPFLSSSADCTQQLSIIIHHWCVSKHGTVRWNTLDMDLQWSATMQPFLFKRLNNQLWAAKWSTLSPSMAILSPFSGGCLMQKGKTVTFIHVQSFSYYGPTVSYSKASLQVIKQSASSCSSFRCCLE